MKKLVYICALPILVILFSCGDKYQLTLESPKTIKIDEPLSLIVKEKNQNPIDSVHYFLDGNRLLTFDNLDISKNRLGQHVVSATVFFNGQEKKLNNTIYFMNHAAPKVFSYEVINEFPHDPKAFTQGFVYHDGFFYESTGIRGASTLRKVEIETGKVVKRHELEREYFGEGMTILNGKIYQLTWQKGIGFIYDLESFEKIGEFKYNKSKEGWGLTHNGEYMIKTDGTERMWFLETADLQEKKYIETYTDKRKAEKLNELEYIDGKIYANIWQQNSMLIVNPTNGAIEAIVNLKGLQEKAGQKGEDYVLNGIAYDNENDRLFVTGKNWNKVFEIKVIEK